ncbi:MAG: cytochrome c oxidase accessory protein CcoG [Flavobacteriales bacterium]|nr:cytochrome c oxidase accessory protein CcoG [Flavobacteriales bacterium]
MNTVQNDQEPDDSFRDSIGTIKEGKRNWIYANKPSGWYYNLRKKLSYVYLIVFFTLPFLKLNGNPLLMLNILERKFIIFGFVFWPHDFFIFGIATLTMIVFVVLFTVVFGRLFCGWACPQTIFLELVFRRIEYWIEGDAPHQRALNKMPWNGEKIRKKSLKYSIFFLISFIISNTFLAYIISADKLFQIISEPVGQHLGGFIALLLFTLVFFFVFAWFREQACLIVCPYGRLQGVLLDKNSIVVAYDYVRGEPRHKFKKNEERDKGDCIDCGLCVKVCPTGIDIRNGTQLECTNCTACIDACDHMMESVGLEKGLIRYDSESGIKNKVKLTFTRRILAYSIVLTLLLGFLTFLLVSRSDVEATIVRAQGSLFQEQGPDKISNLYNVKVINKSHKDIPIQLKLEDRTGEIQMVGDALVCKKESNAVGTFFLILPKEQITERKTTVKIGIYTGDKKLQTVKTSFLGPIKKKKP